MAETIHRSDLLTVTPEVFLARLRDRETIERRCAAEGLAPSTLVDYESHADLVRILVSSDIPTSWLPGIVTARLTGTPHVVREERWQRGEEGLRSPLTFEFAGLPVRCEGTASVTPEGDGSRLTVDLVLRVDVPFVGGAVERAVAPQVGRSLDAETAFYRGL